MSIFNSKLYSFRPKFAKAVSINTWRFVIALAVILSCPRVSTAEQFLANQRGREVERLGGLSKSYSRVAA